MCGPQSTLFNALCENGKAEAANYPFCTIEANSGVVAVPDDRLQVDHSCSTCDRLFNVTGLFSASKCILDGL